MRISAPRPRTAPCVLLLSSCAALTDAFLLCRSDVGISTFRSYIAALIESDFEVVASFTERNAPIYQQDSDFECFVDPSGCCHQYKELEMNALNTVWNLLLDKPYADGGGEFSGRVASEGEQRHYEVRAQRTATRFLSGAAGSPEGAVWAVEIGMAHSDTLSMQPSLPALPSPARPAPGVLWRINFSRVEHKGETNWVWSPQRVWDPSEKRFSGKVNMHLPDAFGYVHFVPDEDTPLLHDAYWPARLAAASLYYAQHRFREEHGEFTSEIGALKHLLPLEITKPFALSVTLPEGDQFLVEVFAPDGRVVTITHERLMLVREADDSDSVTQTCL